MGISHNTVNQNTIGSPALLITTTLPMPAGSFNYVGVVVSVTSASVVTVKDNAGGGPGNTYTLLSAQTVGSDLRLEVWTAPVTNTSAAATVTVTFSGTTLAAVTGVNYIGATSPFLGNLSTNTGTGNVSPNLFTTLKDSGNWIIGFVGTVWASSSQGVNLQDGSSLFGTYHPATYPSVGVSLIESFAPIGQISTAIFTALSGDYAIIASELRTHASAVTQTVEDAIQPASLDIFAPVTALLVLTPPLRDIPALAGNVVY